MPPSSASSTTASFAVECGQSNAAELVFQSARPERRPSGYACHIRLTLPSGSARHWGTSYTEMAALSTAVYHGAGPSCGTAGANVSPPSEDVVV